jgi:surface protein
MESMFEGCIHFNQPLNDWNVSNVEEMSAMFKDNYDFNQSIVGWKLDSLVEYDSIFYGIIDNEIHINNLKYIKGQIQNITDYEKIDIYDDNYYEQYEYENEYDDYEYENDYDEQSYESE